MKLPSLVSSLRCLRVRAHSLKMRREKRVAVAPTIQRRCSTRRNEGRFGHTEEAEDRTQIWLHEIERGHLSLSVVDAAGCNDEGRLLADKQAFWRTAASVGKGPADTRNLVDPELEHGGHTEVMHWHAENILVGPLQFGKQ